MQTMPRPPLLLDALDDLLDGNDGVTFVVGVDDDLDVFAQHVPANRVTGQTVETSE